jgi:hypothetical protein
VLVYAASSAALLGAFALTAVMLFSGAEPAAVWLAAGIAWLVQVAAFWILVAAGRGPGFMIGWASGMALRFGAVGAVAVWLTRTESFDPASALVSLVGFVFVLVLLEPLFLRLAD